MIVSKEERVWSVPLGWVCNYYDFMWTRFYSKIPIEWYKRQLVKFLPDKATKLTTLADIAIHGALGETEQVSFNRDDFIHWEQ